MNTDSIITSFRQDFTKYIEKHPDQTGTGWMALREAYKLFFTIEWEIFRFNPVLDNNTTHHQIYDRMMLRTQGNIKTLKNDLIILGVFSVISLIILMLNINAFSINDPMCPTIYTNKYLYERLIFAFVGILEFVIFIHLILEYYLQLRTLCFIAKLQTINSTN